MLKLISSKSRPEDLIAEVAALRPEILCVGVVVATVGRASASPAIYPQFPMPVRRRPCSSQHGHHPVPRAQAILMRRYAGQAMMPSVSDAAETVFSNPKSPMASSAAHFIEN